MAKTTNPAWYSAGSLEACPEVALSAQLATLASAADAVGFPFTAEHLRQLALYVLDEAAVKYSDLAPDSDADDADRA